MRDIVFAPVALHELSLYKSGSHKLLFKVFELITDIQKTPFSGLGKPEPLLGDYKGYWSRRISDEHRLIYKVTAGTIEIFSCYGHYEK